MKTLQLFFLTLGLVACMLVGQGCDSSTITDPNSKVSIDPVESRLFTGRDSLISQPGGIAITAKLSGDLETTENPECPSPDMFLSGTGSGHVTHLGRTEVEQTACISENNEIRGTFLFEGRSGSHISGTYEGTLDGGSLTAEVIIETTSVRAPRETPPDGEDWGGGRIEGTLTETHFDYELVGWLFHHETQTE